MWIRFIVIGFFSFTAVSLMGYQILEIIQAYIDMLSHKQ